MRALKPRRSMTSLSTIKERSTLIQTSQSGSNLRKSSMSPSSKASYQHKFTSMRLLTRVLIQFWPFQLVLSKIVRNKPSRFLKEKRQLLETLSCLVATDSWCLMCLQNHRDSETSRTHSSTHSALCLSKMLRGPCNWRQSSSSSGQTELMKVPSKKTDLGKSKSLRESMTSSLKKTFSDRCSRTLFYKIQISHRCTTQEQINFFSSFTTRSTTRRGNQITSTRHTAWRNGDQPTESCLPSKTGSSFSARTQSFSNKTTLPKTPVNQQLNIAWMMSRSLTRCLT